jgi:hypothetical protein
VIYGKTGKMEIEGCYYYRMLCPQTVRVQTVEKVEVMQALTYRKRFVADGF